jgi:hypothetical protein
MDSQMNAADLSTEKGSLSQCNFDFPIKPYDDPSKPLVEPPEHPLPVSNIYL